MKKQATTVTSAQGKATNQAMTKKNTLKEEFTMTKEQLSAIVAETVRQTMAGFMALSQVEVEKAGKKKATPKKTAKKSAKTEVVKVNKPNPVQEKILAEQKELVNAFNGKDFGSKDSGDFVAFYRKTSTGSYKRLGHFNKSKGLFWFTKKAITFADWGYIKHNLAKYGKDADFARNEVKFAKAGIKCPSDFAKVSFDTFLNSGVFC